MVDRACIGSASATKIMSPLREYVVKPEDLPIWEIYQCGLRRSGQAMHPPVGGRGDERAARVPPTEGIAPAGTLPQTRCLSTVLPPTLKVKTETELPSPHLSQRRKAGDLAT